MPLWLLWQGLCHLWVASAYAAEWQRLEQHGIQWHFENGMFFRLLFARKDGSGKIDTTLRQARVETEITTVRARRQAVMQSLNDAAIALVIGVVIYVVLLKGLEYFPITAAFGFDAAEAGALFYLAPKIAPNLATLLTSWQMKRDYDRGCQFICGAKVIDPAPQPMTRETVRESNPFGANDFEDPYDASQKLGA